MFKHVQSESDPARKGKLKIFIGMVAGVGKTCAMLESARALRKDGLDVVIGYVETHGRQRTTELVQGLELIPRKKLTYRGAELEEMDLDGILQRRPQLVLVDELAHTNAPGSRHPKRYVDVEEILGAGIDVFTTINVQHFDSRIDLVKTLSGVEIQESVPDSILDRADQVELIDLPPDELLGRLERGEIYPKEKIQRSLQGFFKRSTLTALRELALRLTAEKVDREVVQAVSRYDLPQKTKTHDRLLVAIGPSPSAAELLRWTRNKAYNLEAPWVAAYVDTGSVLSSEDKTVLDENIELAKHLGAEIVSMSSPNVAEALLTLCKERQITEIVVGKPRMSFLHRWIAPESPVEILLKQKAHFTLSLVVTEKAKTPTLLQLLRTRLKSKPLEYVISVGNVALTTTVLYLTVPWIGYRGVGLVFVFSVLYQSLLMGRGPIYLTSLLSALSWNFFFIPPTFTFQVHQKEDFILLVLFVAMAVVLGSLTHRSRSREVAYKTREERASILLEISRVFSEKLDLSTVLKALHTIVREQMGFQVSFYLSQPLGSRFHSFRPEGMTELSPKELGVANWTITNQRRAGRSTDTIPEAEGIYFPLHSGHQTFGTVGFYPTQDPPKAIDFNQKSLLESVARQLTQFLEQKNYFSLQERTKVLEESTKLQKALFSSVSHEFKTPLTAILGNAQALVDSKLISSDVGLQSVTKNLLKNGERLAHVVDELLDMSRLESGQLQSRSEWVSLEDVVGLVLGRLEESLAQRSVEVQGLEKLPLVRADFILLSDVFKNLVTNSIQYSEPHSRIEIRGSLDSSGILVEILDEGLGVSQEFAPRLFERFAREHPNVPGGLGLGLSICQGLMSAMGAEISVGNRQDSKRGFRVALTFGAGLLAS